MVFIYFILFGIFSGVVASFFTAYLIKRTLLVGLTSKNSAERTAHENTLAEDGEYVVLTAPSVEEKNEEPILEKNERQLHEVLMGALTEKRVPIQKTSFLKIFFRNFLKSTCGGVDSFFEAVFSSITLILLPILNPLYRGFELLDQDFRLPKVFTKDVTNSITPNTVQEKSAGVGIFKRIKSVLAGFFVRPKIKKTVVTDRVPVEARMSDSKEPVVTRSMPEIDNTSMFSAPDVFSEILLSLVPLALVALPFIFNFHKQTTQGFFLYLACVALLGAGILFFARSPRSFWAIGIALWSAVAYFFFSTNNTVETTGPAVLFISLFLAVYAISSFTWYNSRTISNRIVEYALYVLHPLIYLASLYLLIAEDMKYTAALVCFSVAALYMYFVTSMTNKTKKFELLLASEIVVFVSLLSAIMVVSDGVLQALLLVCVYAYVFYHKHKFAHFHVIPVLVFIFLSTLEQTNSASAFTFIVNERFAYYVLATFTFMHAYVHTRILNLQFGGFSRACKRAYIALGVLLAYFGVTLEVLDAKVHTNLLPGKSALIALLVIYLSLAVALYSFGKKHGERTVVLLSLVLSLYSVYFISTYLL